MQQQKTQYPQSKDGGLWIKQDGGQVCSIRNTQAASADYKRKPDYSGNIKLTPEMMKLLIQMAKDGKEMTIQLSAWEKTPKAGGAPYISSQKDSSNTSSRSNSSRSISLLPRLRLQCSRQPHKLHQHLQVTS